MMPNPFDVRKDGEGIPVAGYESPTDAIVTAVSQLVSIAVTQTTSASGLISLSTKPIAAVARSMDHVGNLTDTYGITAIDAGTLATYYVGNIDPNAGTFTVYADSGLTTPKINTSCNITYFYLAPVKGTLNSDGTVTPNMQLSGRNVTYQQVMANQALAANGVNILVVNLGSLGAKAIQILAKANAAIQLKIYPATRAGATITTGTGWATGVSGGTATDDNLILNELGGSQYFTLLVYDRSAAANTVNYVDVYATFA